MQMCLGYAGIQSVDAFKLPRAFCLQLNSFSQNANIQVAVKRLLSDVRVATSSFNSLSCFHLCYLSLTYNQLIKHCAKVLHHSSFLYILLEKIIFTIIMSMKMNTEQNSTAYWSSGIVLQAS